ncbi:hypothetical protein [Aequorivita marina]|uniref:hypothetical protein n=1 Tax=Aequorivita marina TaxID=3073654 RepID=UPI0028753671|nr:hypothetical protein [Aequorivita sp. S2608]MDS1298067.1 hypothetical protein [Aequorivita sp. S2608]
MNTCKLARIIPSIIILLMISLKISAQVGVETDDPTTTIDVNAALSLREGTPLPLTNGNNNAINLGSNPYSFYRIIGPTSSFSIGGILPVDVPDGQIVTLQNTTNQVMSIIHLSPGAAGPNRITVPGVKDFIVRGKYASVTFQYTKNNNKWSLLNKLNHAETWYYPPSTLYSNTSTTFTGGLPHVTKYSGFSINVTGPSIGDMDEDLTIEYKEARSGQLIFRVKNNAKFTSYYYVQFAITLYND